MSGYSDDEWGEFVVKIIIAITALAALAFFLALDALAWLLRLHFSPTSPVRGVLWLADCIFALLLGIAVLVGQFSHDAASVLAIVSFSVWALAVLVLGLIATAADSGLGSDDVLDPWRPPRL